MFYGHAAHFWFTGRKYSSQEKKRERKKKSLFLLLCERRARRILRARLTQRFFNSNNTLISVAGFALSAVRQNFKKPLPKGLQSHSSSASTWFLVLKVTLLMAPVSFKRLHLFVSPWLFTVLLCVCVRFGQIASRLQCEEFLSTTPVWLSCLRIWQPNREFFGGFFPRHLVQCKLILYRIIKHHSLKGLIFKSFCIFPHLGLY